ncbi:MAG: sulfotransferase [Gammaproteobacteria bacterium]|nr:sulfotransferase [Gammaproteobacteria bacterium]
MRSSQYSPVKSWSQFDRKVRFSGRKLLGELDRFENCILVAGCQRSGTTALSRLLTASEGMVNFQFGSDDELDAALILSGWESYPSEGRFCFQTTYLNNSYPEYFEHADYKLIWVLRNPYSVIYSMLHNWKIGALNRLFRHCGHEFLAAGERWKYEKLGSLAVSRLRKACLSYNAKISQTAALKDEIDQGRVIIIDYDDLIKNKAHILPKLYNFTGLNYREEYLSRLHAKSLSKADKFSGKEAGIIESLCTPFYLDARRHLSADLIV